MATLLGLQQHTCVLHTGPANTPSHVHVLIVISITTVICCHTCPQGQFVGMSPRLVRFSSGLAPVGLHANKCGGSGGTIRLSSLQSVYPWSRCQRLQSTCQGAATTATIPTSSHAECSQLNLQRPCSALACVSKHAGWYQSMLVCMMLVHMTSCMADIPVCPPVRPAHSITEVCCPPACLTCLCCCAVVPLQSMLMEGSAWTFCKTSGALSMMCLPSSHRYRCVFLPSLFPQQRT